MVGFLILMIRFGHVKLTSKLVMVVLILGWCGRLVI